MEFSILNIRMRIISIAIAILVLDLINVSRAEDDPLGRPEMKKFAKGAVELGWRYFHKGDYDTALRRFQMAIRHDKTFAPGYFGAAYVYSVEGKLDDAIKYYRETLKYDPRYPYTFANLGFALLQEEQFDEALEMLDKALALDPNCGEAHYSYAQYFARKENWAKAGDSANKAIDCGIKLHPDFRRLLEKNGVNLKKNPAGAVQAPPDYTAPVKSPAAAA